MKMLGVDYGTKHVGIAMSDDSGSIAFPEVVVDRRNALQTITNLVAERHVKAIIIGESRDQEGRRNSIARDVDEFVQTLHRELKLPVVLEQEGFTTWHARQRIPAQRGTLSRVRQERVEGRVDASAAALILQRYLDRGAIPTNNT